ncbi:MAG: hypothetical protein JOS17DRAFT_26872 [Linnemannia elongata]|nr:MAG: hypothetical protein JOS17DRAFT_26872 [Linnemannia elongata]
MIFALFFVILLLRCFSAVNRVRPDLMITLLLFVDSRPSFYLPHSSGLSIVANSISNINKKEFEENKVSLFTSPCA